MVRTPKAERLRQPLASLLRATRSLLSEDEFDAKTSRRTFTFMMPDLVCDLIGPRLVLEIANQAPGVKLLFTPWRGPAIADEKGLAATDFIITSVERPFQGFSPEQLYEDTDVVAVRTGHRAREKLSTRSSFSNAQHIAIVGSGELEDVSEPWLRSVGLVRQIALQVPTYLLALRIVSQTDLVAFVPRGLARSMARSLKLTTVACPVDPGSDQMMLWTATRLAGDPAASWMRSRLRALFDNAD